MRIRILIQIQISAIQLRHHHQQVRPGEHSAAYSKFNFRKQLQAYSNPSNVFTQAENNITVFRIRIGSGSSILGLLRIRILIQIQIYAIQSNSAM